MRAAGTATAQRVNGCRQRGETASRWHGTAPATPIGPFCQMGAPRVGTLWGPLLGAVSLHILADVTRNLFGQLPGINMVIYGVVLIVIVMFLPRGIAGLGTTTPLQWLRGSKSDGDKS